MEDLQHLHDNVDLLSLLELAQPSEDIFSIGEKSPKQSAKQQQAKPSEDDRLQKLADHLSKFGMTDKDVVLLSSKEGSVQTTTAGMPKTGEQYAVSPVTDSKARSLRYAAKSAPAVSSQELYKQPSSTVIIPARTEWVSDICVVPDETDAEEEVCDAVVGDVSGIEEDDDDSDMFESRLFTCPSQPFHQRLSLMGEMFFNS